MEAFFSSLFDEVQGLSPPGLQSEAERCALKTALLVDSMPDEASLAFLLNEERCIVLDGYKMHFDRTMRKRKLPLILEDARLVLLNAMVHGKTLVFRLKDVCLDLLTCDDEHCPDLDPVVEPYPPYSKISYLPACWHFNGGAALRTEEWYTRVIHRKDFGKSEPRPPCHPRFSVVFCTTVPEADLDARLFRGSVGLPARHNFRVLALPPPSATPRPLSAPPPTNETLNE